MKIGNKIKSICKEVSRKKREKEAELSQPQLKLKEKLRLNSLFTRVRKKINAMKNVSQAIENSSL